MSKDRRLSGKQREFINAYFGKANFNATKAAELSGYSGNGVTLATTGFQNLRKPQIADEISKRFKEKAMGADEVVMRLGEQARAEYSEYLFEDGRIDIKRLLAAGKGHLIKSTVPTKEGNRIEFYDGQSALAMIAKHHGLLTDRHEIKIADELGHALDLLQQNLSEDAFNDVLKILSSNS